MRGNKKYPSKYRMQSLLLSTVISVLAIFCIPNIVNGGIGKEVEHLKAFIAVFVLGEVFAVGILCWMGISRSKNKSVFQVIKRVLGTLGALFLVMMVISLLCGLISVLLYDSLKMILSFGQIKGIINFLTTVLVFLTIPFMESIFWNEITMQKKFMESLKAGIKVKRKKYVSLFLISTVLFVIGYLIAIAFDYMAANVITDIIKAIIFTLLGTLGLSSMERATQ